MYYPDNEEEKIVNGDGSENETPKNDETARPEGTISPEEEMKQTGQFDFEDEIAKADEETNDFVTEEYTVKEEKIPNDNIGKNYNYSPTPEQPSGTTKKPKKKNGVYVSGAAIAVLMICVIVFVGVMSIGIWKIADYMRSPVDTSGDPAVTTPVDTSSSKQQPTPTEPDATSGKQPVSPSGDSSISGAAITPSGTVTSNTSTPETDMIANCRKSVVEISLYSNNTLLGHGSGVIYTTDGYILTNYHVVTDTKLTGYTAVVRLFDGTEYEAAYVCGDLETDITVIKINKNDCVAATIGNSDTSVVGERVYAIGNPNGDGITVTEGILSAKNRSLDVQSSNVTIRLSNMLLITAPINAGNSGGGLFNAKGELIGIVNSKTYYDKSGNTVEGEGMAIPSARVVACVDTLVANDGYIPGKAKLGVTINSRTLSSGWNSITYYTCVTKVAEDSAAEVAGIKEGDIITALGDVNLIQYKNQNGLLSDYDALHMILLGYKTGDSTTVTVLRPETTSTMNGYQSTTYKEVTLDITFLDFNYSK